jgi:prepilin-type N-terminal cleavage/methylation domain-containing protein
MFFLNQIKKIFKISKSTSNLKSSSASVSTTTFTSHISGFTLLEMIVSLGIFSVVAVIAVGSLVRITGLNRQAQSMQSAMNNINFALESMSREMRVGTSFHCVISDASNVDGRTLTSQFCDNDNGGITLIKGVYFKSSKVDPNNATCPLVYAYWFVRTTVSNPWKLLKAQQTSCNDNISYVSATPIIDDTNVFITDFNLGVSLGVNGINKYSWAAVGIKGYSGTKEKEKNYFDVRTGISQRISD